MAPHSIRRLELFPQTPRSVQDLERDPERRARIERTITDVVARAEVIGVGTQARVVAEPQTGAAAAWCAKEATTQSIERFNRTPHEEIVLQQHAYDAVARARDADPTRPLARVPQPIAYVELDPPAGERAPLALIIMERIVGTTAFRALLNHIVRADDRCIDLRNGLPHLADTTLEEQLLTRLALRTRAPRAQVAALAATGAHLGFRVSRDALVGVHRAMSACHDAGLYHRDAHPRNIMLPEDSALPPYIIDFGKSLAVPAGMTPGAFDPYEDHYGEERMAYPNDGDFRAFLEQFAPKRSGA